MEYFYPAIVKHDAKGGIFSVIFPDLNGCQAQGRTAEEAVLKAREALAASLLEMEEKGLEIPPASDERLFRLRYGGSRCCTILVNMETYREYREYKVRARRSSDGGMGRDSPQDKTSRNSGKSLRIKVIKSRGFVPRFF